MKEIIHALFLSNNPDLPGFLEQYEKLTLSDKRYFTTMSLDQETRELIKKWQDLNHEVFHEIGYSYPTHQVAKIKEKLEARYYKLIHNIPSK